jgi:hypothetical protein
MGFKRGAPGIGSKYSARDLASIDASGLRKMRPLRISGRPLHNRKARQQSRRNPAMRM